MQAMILAAGLGTRLRPYSLLRPKPLFPVVNTPLILRIIEQLRLAGCDSIVVNAHHLREQISALLSKDPGISLQLEDIILGTGGGLRLARPCFGADPVLVVNGDIYHTIDLGWVMSEHQRLDDSWQASAPVTMVLHDFPRFNGVAVDQDLRVLGFDGYSDNLPPDANRLAFAGIHVVDPAIFERMPSGAFYNIIDCYRELISEGIPVRGILAQDHLWSDIGTPLDYLALHGQLLTADRTFGEDNTTPPVCPSSVAVHDGALVAEDVGFHGWVCVGEGAEIGEGAELTRVIVWDRAKVSPGAMLKDTIIV